MLAIVVPTHSHLASRNLFVIFVTIVLIFLGGRILHTAEKCMSYLILFCSTHSMDDWISCRVGCDVKCEFSCWLQLHSFACHGSRFMSITYVLFNSSSVFVSSVRVYVGVGSSTCRSSLTAPSRRCQRHLTSSHRCASFAAHQLNSFCAKSDKNVYIVLSNVRTQQLHNC